MPGLPAFPAFASRRLAAASAIACLAGLSGVTTAHRPAHATPAELPATGIRLTRFASGFDQPVHLVSAPGERRLYVVEQTGRIRVIENGEVRREPFLDLTDRVRAGGERGLLGLAFHPRYAENGFLYVNYTDRAGDTQIERFTAAAGRRVADHASAKTILSQAQPYSNHNGGHLLFGPDGMLYVPLGDGGAGGDPGNRAQDPATWLGKLLRIDVDRGDPYAVPPDNPFAKRRGALPEIWALGLRNPWRVAFDAPSGLLYIADVGQNEWEEINVVRASRAGLNYGWRYFEGSRGFRRAQGEPRGMIAPLVEYDHGEGCSVTGGLVYRGTRIAALRGDYLYSDYCSGWIRSFRVVDGRPVERHQWQLESPGNVTSFGADADGEAYVACHDGAIYRIDPGE